MRVLPTSSGVTQLLPVRMVGGAPLSASVSSSARAIKVVVGAAPEEKPTSSNFLISSVRAPPLRLPSTMPIRRRPSRSADATML